MQLFTSFLFLPSKHLLLLCSWLTWKPAPQGETSSLRNDLPCQPREDEATGQYAAVWLPTCAPHAELNSLNLAFSKNVLHLSFSLFHVPCLTRPYSICWWVAAACQETLTAAQATHLMSSCWIWRKSIQSSTEVNFSLGVKCKFLHHKKMSG